MDNEILLSLVEERQQLNAQQKAIDAKRKEYDEKIKVMIGEGVTVVGNYSITKNSLTVKRLDTARLKKDYPDLINVYMNGKFENRFMIVELNKVK